jgi:hypothetical protein
MLNPWAIVGALVLVIGAFFYGRHTGAQATRADWEAEKVRLAADAAQALAKANQEVRELEQLLANTQTKVEKVYVDKVREVQVVKTEFIDVARSGGLFIDAQCPDRNDPLPSAATSSSSDHGKTKARLSAEAAEALIAIAADADEIVHQLTACQAILRDERELQRSATSRP